MNVWTKECQERKAWYTTDGQQAEGPKILPGRPLCCYIPQRSLLVTSIRDTIFTVAGRAMYRNTLSTKEECFRETTQFNWGRLGEDVESRYKDRPLQRPALVHLA
jgi:hypothetical protein